jgi:hypothetical protein
MGEFFMSAFTPMQSFNPWDEGDYRVYGYAAVTPDGNYWPAYQIDRVHGIPSPPQQAVPLHQVKEQSFATEDLAKMMAVSLGVARVRAQDRLGC